MKGIFLCTVSLTMLFSPPCRAERIVNEYFRDRAPITKDALDESLRQLGLHPPELFAPQRKKMSHEAYKDFRGAWAFATTAGRMFDELTAEEKIARNIRLGNLELGAIPDHALKNQAIADALVKLLEAEFEKVVLKNFEETGVCLGWEKLDAQIGAIASENHLLFEQLLLTRHYGITGYAVSPLPGRFANDKVSVSLGKRFHEAAKAQVHSVVATQMAASLNACKPLKPASDTLIPHRQELQERQRPNGYEELRLEVGRPGH